MNSNLKKYLNETDAILISSWGNIIYFTGYSGFSETERECFLLITKTKQYLITDKRYSQALKHLKNFVIIDIGIKEFITNDHSNILKNLRIRTLGFESNNLTAAEYFLLKKFVKLKNRDLSDLRIIKQKEEIENIKKACALGDIAFKFILDKLKTGVSELQIANEIESFIKDKGAKISFKSIIAFGKNSAIPHHLSDKTKLKKNQIVLLDFGVKINNYCSDMSRTVFFGKADEKFKKMHKVVLEARQRAIQFINSQLPARHGKQGVAGGSIINSQLLASDIDKTARDYIIAQGFPSIIHSVGHGIGIEVHETPHLSPSSKEVIKPGMVFSVEPGIYIPGFGGIRIEDLVVVGKGKMEVITRAKKSLIEL